MAYGPLLSIMGIADPSWLPCQFWFCLACCRQTPRQLLSKRLPALKLSACQRGWQHMKAALQIHTQKRSPRWRWAV